MKCKTDCQCGRHQKSQGGWNRGLKASDEARKHIREGVIKAYAEGRIRKPENHSQTIGRAIKTGRPFSFGAMSTRTIQKVMKRIGAKCALCGWNESSCDIHHVFGRKIENAHALNNLIILCPNHHRLVHNRALAHKWWVGKTMLDLIGQDALDKAYYG